MAKDNSVRRHISMPQPPLAVEFLSDDDFKKNTRHMSLQELKHDLQHSFGLKAASLAATINNYASRLNKRTASVESLSGLDNNQFAVDVSLSRVSGIYVHVYNFYVS